MSIQLPRGSVYVSASVVRESETRGIKERKMKERGSDGKKDCDWDV
jgi:hypothetical protein